MASRLQFRQEYTTVRYKNPFGNNGTQTSDKFYTVENPKVFRVGGGLIVKRSDKHFDYVVNDVCITQRCGASAELLKALIKENVKPLDWTHQLEINLNLDKRSA